MLIPMAVSNGAWIIGKTTKNKHPIKKIIGKIRLTWSGLGCSRGGLITLNKFFIKYKQKFTGAIIIQL